MSVISGGTALNPCSSGGSRRSAGSAGISMTFFTFQAEEAEEEEVELYSAFPPPAFPPSLYHIHTDADKSFERDHHAYEPVRLPRIAGGPQLQRHLVLVAQMDFLLVPAFRRFHTWSEFPYFPPRSSSGTTPEVTMLGVPHSLVMVVSWPRCQAKS